MFNCNAHKIGALNELKAQQYYMEQDYDVFTPIHGKTRADFIAVKGTEVLRVQVKTAQYNSVYIQARLDVDGARYTDEDCDVIVFILEDRMWVAPIKEISGFTSVCLGKVSDSAYKTRKDYNPDNWLVK